MWVGSFYDEINDSNHDFLPLCTLAKIHHEAVPSAVTSARQNELQSFNCFLNRHCNIARSYPILIGTIPLRSTIPSASYQQNVPQPTAPIIDPPPPMPSPDYAPPIAPYPSPRPRTLFFSSDQPGTSTNQWDMRK